MLDVMLEFLNKLSRAQIHILGIKTMCISLIRVCAKGYIEDLKG
jgi:hypothetical protein